VGNEIWLVWCVNEIEGEPMVTWSRIVTVLMTSGKRNLFGRNAVICRVFFPRELQDDHVDCLNVVQQASRRGT
jgi:hypothetical protein